MRFKIDPDTKDALLFTTGLLGIIAQAILAALQVPVSVPLIGAFLAMMGIAAGPSILGLGKGAPSDPPPADEDDKADEPPVRPRRGRTADG